jgi:hypothetical protein
MDMVVAATEARRVPFSFSIRVGEHKKSNFSRSLLLAVGHKRLYLRKVQEYRGGSDAMES